MGDFENKFLQMRVGRKKLHAAQIEYKKFMHCCKKEKNVTNLFHHSESFTKIIQAKLQPFCPCSLLNSGMVMLQNYYFM